MPTFVYPASATGGHRRAGAPAPHHAALGGDVAQARAQEREPPPGHAAVGLELGLARAAGADAAPEPLEVLPHPAHALQRVLELGQLDLELALGGVRVLGEDVQDHRRAVDHPHLQRILERALLARRQLVVRDDHLGVDLRQELAQLVELARAEVGARIGAAAVLHERGDGPHARGPQELAHLPQLVGAVGARQEGRHHHPALGILVTGGVHCHEEQYKKRS